MAFPHGNIALIVGTVGRNAKEFIGTGSFDMEKKRADTPYGIVEYWVIWGEDWKFYLIERHYFSGSPQYPHMIKPAAYIYFLYQIKGVRFIFSTSAVGAYPNHENDFRVGSLIVPQTYLDLRGEPIDICPLSGELPKNFDLALGHHSPEGAVCPEMIGALRREEVFCLENRGWGCLAATTGPLFESPAEKKALRILGADFLGMHTLIREWKWAALLNLHFLPILHVTNIIQTSQGDSGEAVEGAARDSNCALLEQFFRTLNKSMSDKIICRCSGRHRKNIFEELGFFAP